MAIIIIITVIFTTDAGVFTFLLYFAGAIFSEEQKHSHIELAFKYAVHKINRDRVILPKTTLVYDIQYVPRDDSFHATKKGKRNDTTTTIL